MSEDDELTLHIDPSDPLPWLFTLPRDEAIVRTAAATLARGVARERAGREPVSDDLLLMLANDGCDSWLIKQIAGKRGCNDPQGFRRVYTAAFVAAYKEIQL